MALNRFGQAALTDSLYFLLIVSGLSTFLFFFSASYGVSVSEQVGLEYRSDYATSALKTLMYSSVPRIYGETLEESSQVDFLFAAVKEDYADNEKFEQMKAPLVNSVLGVMEPLSDSFDYMFYIYVLNTEDFAFLMLHVTEFNKDDPAKVTYGQKKIYTCLPNELDNLDPLVTSIGNIYQSNSRIQLISVKESGGTHFTEYQGQLNLTMWTSTDLPKVETGTIFDASHLNCECFKKLALKNPSCNPFEDDCESEWVDC